MLKAPIKRLVSSFGYDIISKKSMPPTNYLMDRKVFDLYERAQVKCQMTGSDNDLRRQRHYTLNHLLWNTDLTKGDVCELGCWRGLSAYQIATHMKETKAPVKFHIFDSFEGLSEYEAVDIPANNRDDLAKRRRQFACSLPEVQENLKEFTFIQYYPGWIPEKFDEVRDKRFSFIHVDVDLYQPIFDSVEFFYPRLVGNGVMVFDDYGYTAFPGAKKAVDDCLKRFGNPLFIPLASGQAFLIKNK